MFSSPRVSTGEGNVPPRLAGISRPRMQGRSARRWGHSATCWPWHPAQPRPSRPCARPDCLLWARAGGPSKAGAPGDCPAPAPALPACAMTTGGAAQRVARVCRPQHAGCAFLWGPLTGTPPAAGPPVPAAGCGCFSPRRPRAARPGGRWAPCKPAGASTDGARPARWRRRRRPSAWAGSSSPGRACGCGHGRGGLTTRGGAIAARPCRHLARAGVVDRHGPVLEVEAGGKPARRYARVEPGWVAAWLALGPAGGAGCP